MAKRYAEEQIPAVYSRDEIPVHETRDGVSFQRFRSVEKSVGFVRAEPGGESFHHKHPWEQIVYVLDGHGEFLVGDEVLSIEAGDLFFVPPNVDHELRPQDVTIELFVVWPYSESHDEQYSYQSEFYPEAAE